MRRTSTMVAVVLALTGCVVDTETETRVAEITNGGAAIGSDAVVGVMLDGVTVCTGTLISPAVVLTAGHCVAVGPEAIFVGSSATETTEVIDIVRSATALGYQWPELHDDVGLLGLAYAASPVPIDVYRESLDDFAGADIRIVGFGATDGLGAGLGEKREGHTRIAELDADSFTYHPEPSQTCLGDSGGPALHTVKEEQEAVVGVTSAGDPDCERFAISGRIDRYVDDLIDPFVEQHESGLAGCSTSSHASSECAWVLVASLLAVAARRRRPPLERNVDSAIPDPRRRRSSALRALPRATADQFGDNRSGFL